MSQDRAQDVSQLLAQLHTLGVQLWNADGQLHFRAPRGALTETLREQLKSNRQHVLRQLELAQVTPPQPAPDPGRWFRTWQPNVRASQRVLCLPHAGGSASFFRNWEDSLPDHVELVAVQYPGREERINEPLIDQLAALVSGIADALQQTPRLLDRPYVLFGHSMGSAIAHELCLELQRRGCRQPTRLLVSACEAPSRRRPESFHLANDEELKNELLRLGGTSDAMTLMPELIDLVMPVVRSDYQAIETYVPQPGRGRLSIPITALTGNEYQDADLADIQAWAEETVEAFEHRVFPGGHFYLMQQQAEVLEVVRQCLCDAAKAS